MVIVLLLGIPHGVLHGFLALGVVVLRFPLDTLFLLKGKGKRSERGAESRSERSLPAAASSVCWLTENWETHTVRAAPLALWRFLHIWIQTNHMVGTRASVTQDDLSPLLAHLAVVLVVCFVSVNGGSRILFSWKGTKGGRGVNWLVREASPSGNTEGTKVGSMTEVHKS